MKFPRRSGIILHPTSLPSRYGIGDWGPAAYRFVDFLAKAQQTYWQMLPLSPTGYGDSPYQALSAFAGNPMLISPDRLAATGQIDSATIAELPRFPTEYVDFGWVIDYKMALLRKAYDNFRQRQQPAAFEDFCQREGHWLDEYALFAALKDQFGQRPWIEWDEGLAHRDGETLDRWREQLVDDIERQKYWQWLFFEQLAAIKQYANERGVQLIGDIPIFVAYDSADVWANADLFDLDANLEPNVVSGVPPDYFSATGQLWGHPHYRWQLMAERGFQWWISRFRMMQLQADVIRIDHFRAFYDYWEVPASAETAIVGKWQLGPGAAIFRTVSEALGDVPIIAEDLGDFEDDARAGLDAIQAEFGYPGMKVLVFAFDGPQNIFMPHNYTPNNVCYTGTHDNATAVGWYTQEASEGERDFARRYLASNGADIAWDLIRLAWASVADTAMTTAQDLLSLGNEAKMNTPGTVGPPNWCWRLPPYALHEGVAARLAELTAIYGRNPQ